MTYDFGDDLPPLIEVGYVVSRVVNVERGLLFKLDDALAVEVPGAQYAIRNRPGWDGRWHPVNPLKGTFPTGLVGMVRKLLPMASVVDKRERPRVLSLDRNILKGHPLRDYQFQCLQAFFAEDRGALSGRGILGISVGGGKTPTGIALGLHVPGKCVVVLHRKDLLHQWLDELKKFAGLEAAAIGDGAWDDRARDPGTKFVVAMPQTVGKSLSEFAGAVKDARVLLIDEAQRATSPEWYKVVQQIPAYFRAGLTGTPELPDQVKTLRLKAATGNLIFRVGASALAEMGHLVPCTVISHRVSNPAVFGDWHSVRRMLIEENEGRNKGIAALVKNEVEASHTVLILTDTVLHAKILLKEITALDLNVKLVTGKQGSQDRKVAKNDLKQRLLDVAISTTWHEGVDIPNLDVVVLAAGGKSSVLLLQRIGRALRNAPGKKEGIVHDFFDTGHRWVLSHSMMRQALCKKEKFTIKQGFEIKGVPGQPPSSVVEDYEIHEPDGGEAAFEEDDEIPT